MLCLLIYFHENVPFAEDGSPAADIMFMTMCCETPFCNTWKSARRYCDRIKRWPGISALCTTTPIPVLMLSINNLAVLSVVFALLNKQSCALEERDDSSEEPNAYERVFKDFEPSTAAALVGGIAYFMIAILHSWFMVRNRSWWSWCLPVGAIGSGLGLVLRAAFIVQKPDDIALYATSTALILVMPALFLAFNYMTYVRLIMHNIGAKHTLLKPNIAAKVFVGVDLFSFIVQVASSPLMTEEETKHIGQIIFQVGVVVQSISYYAFCCCMAWTHYSVKTKHIGVTGRESWWVITWCLYASSLFIIIRSIYRMIEVFTPKGTGVHVNEGYLYGFDIVPLILCTIPYLWRWPAKYMGQDRINYEVTSTLESVNSTYKMVATRVSPNSAV